MKPITAPLKLGQTGSEVGNLQDILLLLINENQIDISGDISLIDRLAEERTKQLLGSGTYDILKIVQATYGTDGPSAMQAVPLTMIAAINEALADLKPAIFTVQGSVSHVSGKQLRGAFTADIYLITYDGQEFLGTTFVGDNGAYICEIPLPDTIPALIDITAKNGVHVVINKTGAAPLPVATKDQYGTGDSITVNISVESNDILVTAEYNEVYSELQAAIGISNEIADIDIDDADTLTLLVNKTAEQANTIRQMVLAYRLHTLLTDIDTDLLYGLLRQNMPNTVQALATQQKDAFYNALKVTAANHIIHSMDETALLNAASAIETAVSVYILSTINSQDPEASGLYRIIQDIATITGDDAALILKAYKAYVNSGGTPLQDAMNDEGVGEEATARLEQALHLMVLTGNNALLVQSAVSILHGEPGAGEPELEGAGENVDAALLTNLTQEDWQTIIAARKDEAGFFFPDFITANSAPAKIVAYAQFLEKQFDLAYPTHAIVKAVAAATTTPFMELKTSLSSFMLANPDFDLRTVPATQLSTSETFDFDDVDNKEAFIEEAATVQRLMSVTSDYTVISEMAKDGLTSSLKIVRQSVSDFTAKYASVSGGEEAAKQLYDTAQNNVLSLMNTVLDAKQAYTEPTFSVFEKDLTSASAQQLSAYAEWRALFGSLDGCECSQCQSVYSPAAYLTDLLNFIKNQLPAMYDILLARRPDIRNIELTCKNINTAVPHIDIVNELLEDLVSQETYSNNRVSKPYMMYARQTGADAKSQRAIPEHVNTDANGKRLYAWDDYNHTNAEATIYTPYDKLKSAGYPWSLPYNFYKRQIDVHLDIAGIQGYEISQRFSDRDKLIAWDSIDFCADYIGISQTEYYDIISSNYTGSFAYYGFKMENPFSTTVSDLLPITDPKNRGLAYPSTGVVTQTNWQNLVKNRVDVFLQQTGLAYTELLELLDCHVINPFETGGFRQMTIGINTSATSEATCDLSELKIGGIGNRTFDLLHRFVRLKRALGWTYYELDNAMLALSPDLYPAGIFLDTSMFKKLVQIKYLTTTLNLSVEEATSFWRNIDFRNYRNYQKSEFEDIPNEYNRLFRNPAVTNINAAGYPFPEAISPLAATTTFDAELSYISGILKTAGSELQILLANLNITPTPVTNIVHITLDQLSLLRRQTLLMHGMKLKANELLRYRELFANDSTLSTTANAFIETIALATSANSLPLQSIRFIDFVKASRNSGMSIDQVNYLLNDAQPNTVEDQKLNDQIVKSVTVLRSELVKKALPDYIAGNAANDAEGKVFESILLNFFDADKAKYLVQIIHTSPDADTDDTIIRRVAFIEAETAFFLNATDRLIMTDVVTSPEDKRIIFFNKLDAYYKSNTLKATVISFLSKEIKLSETLTKTLLENCLPANDDTFTQVTFVNSTDKLVSWLDHLQSTAVGQPLIATYQDQFKLYYRLHKAALIINTLHLNENDVKALWSSTPVINNIIQPLELPVRSSTTLVPVPLHKWINFLRWMEVRQFLDKDMNVLYDALHKLPGAFTTATKEDMLQSLAIIFKTAIADIEILLGEDALTTGALNALIADYKTPELYLRIIDCLEIQQQLPSPMSTLSRIAIATRQASAQSDANEVIQAVKSQYDEAAWQEVIRPANDLMRTERRDAMVAYLLANPPDAYMHSWLTPNDIYETMMVDIEMMSCMSTTRVLLAVNTVQLWVDRVLLGIEKDAGGTKLLMNKDGARQWHTWRKLYRVWEANRKVFIYPENWIEPELRDDKSPFFKELEKFLKQNELTSENVEDAYKTYLERLEEVANLEIIGYVPQEIKDINNALLDTVVHVWGRTKSNPQIYFYRKRVMGVWNAWEKMDVQIDSDNLAPVLWKGRLRVYWLSITEIQNPETHKVPENEDEPYPSKALKIELNWTELKNGKWQPRQIGKESLKTDYYGPSRPIDISYHYVINSDAHPYTVKTFNDSFQYLKDSMTPYAYITNNGDLKIVVHGRKKFISHTQLNPILRGKYPNGDPVQAVKVNTGINDWLSDDHYPDYNVKPSEFGKMYYYTEDLWKDENMHYDNFRGCFAIKHDKVHIDANIPNTFFHTLIESFPLKSLKSTFTYAKSKPEGYRHIGGYSPSDGDMLLGLAPGFDGAPTADKAIVLSKIALEGQGYIPFDKFFYQDYKNSFFIEKTNDHNFYEDVLRYRPPFYVFQNFNHGRIDQFQDKLFKEGVDGLLNRTFITASDPANEINFRATYAPTSKVRQGYYDEYIPTNAVDFRDSSAFGIYNWELFFHIPMLIANKLMQDQKFEEARKWYHYVFNPTVGEAQSVADFWNFPEFYNNAISTATPVDLMSDPNLQAAVDRWANDPFKPHLVARTRISAYMKNVVMKYLDNLVAWGDALYRTDTRENINEATLLYILASQLLGRKPEKIAARATAAAYTYAALNNIGFNAFSNAMVKIETILLPSGARRPITRTGLLPIKSMYYFCTPPNDKMRSYWDTLGDRLFKIRNCQNIDGIERELALFDPPIDPALLVKAAANGLSLSEALSDINSPLPLYRFNIMSQKATELVQEVKGLGSQLLSALEKKDAEKLSLLRSSQELTMLNLVTEIKQQQLAESVSQINGLQQQQKMTTQRRDYYKKLVDEGLNAYEQLQLASMMASIPLKTSQGAMQTLAGVLHAFPEVKLGAFTTIGFTWGGANAGSVMDAAATATGTVATLNDIVGQMASIKGSYVRRKEDWNLQLKTAEVELKQIDIQILGAQIRKAMAELELRNHQTQMQNAQEMDETMRNKYTNEDLYDWMVGEISVTYFQAYKLAMDVAKRAERCYHHELGIDDTSFIQPAYWDSLKKGLLAGEQLMYDLKRMETSYLEKNKRHLELSKHISLAQLAPDKLQELKNKNTGNSCTVDLPEWLFDLDYPGQHMRRIKSVSVSIPCVAGPYTTVSCKLSLVSSKYRKNGSLNGAAYNTESQYKQLYGSIQSIATSSAQNDSGMFEFSFRDERYLPFEGAGAISTWRIELPAAYAQFDYNSISDIILHVNYTALDEGGLKTPARTTTEDALAALNDAGDGFLRGFSLKQEFSNEWYAYHSTFQSDKKALEIKLNEQLFPYFCKDKSITINELAVILKPKATLAGNYTLKLTYNEDGAITTIPLVLNGVKPINLRIDGNVKIMKLVMTHKESGVDVKVDMTTLLDDLYLIAHCTCAEPDSGTQFPGDDDLDSETVDPMDSLINKMQAWWKADAGITTSTGGVITNWADQSGNGKDLTPVTGTEPSIRTSGQNNINPVAFNGNAALYTGAFQDTASFTANVLIKVNSAGTGFTGIIGRNTAAQTTGWQFWLFNSLYVPVVFDHGGSAYSFDHQLATNVPDLGNWELLTIRRDAVNNVFTWWKNGIKINDYPCGPTSLLGNNPISIGSLGAGNHYGYFDMLETIIYDEALTDAEVASTHQYLQAKYNLPQLPIAQPMAWWKSDKGITLENGKVNSWEDQSGNGHTVVPRSSITKPSYINGVVEANQSQQAMLKLSADLNIGKTYTISIICRQDEPFRQILGNAGIYGSGSGYGLYFQFGDVLTHEPRPAYFEVSSPFTIPTNTECSYRLERDNHNFSLYRNNQLLGTTTSTDNPDFIIDNLYGETAGDGFAGGIKDIIIYGKLLSPGETTQLENYLNVTYNL